MVLSWGLPRIIIRKVGTEKFIELYHPAEGTTELTTSKGDKTEAKIEGGENEAVRYGKSTYLLATTLRLGTNDGVVRPKIVEDKDGIIEGEYEVWLQPEDKTAPGLHFFKSTMSVEDTWTAADGGQWVYNFDALSDGEHKQCETGICEITGEYLSPTAVKFTATTAETAE